MTQLQLSTQFIDELKTLKSLTLNVYESSQR